MDNVATKNVRIPIRTVLWWRMRKSGGLDEWHAFSYETMSRAGRETDKAACGKSWGIKKCKKWEHAPPVKDSCVTCLERASRL